MAENIHIDLEKQHKQLVQENIALQSEKEVYKQAFQENLKFMRNLLDNAGFGTALFDKEGNIGRVNNIICSMTNYTSNELLNLKLENLFENKSNLNLFLENDSETCRFEEILLRKDNSSFIAKCIFAPNLNFYGKINGYYLLVEDITEKKRDEEKLRIEKTYFKHLFDDSPEAIAIIDKEGKITNINTKFTKLFRYSPEGCHKKNIDILLPSKNYSDESNNFLRNTFNNKKQYIETIRKRKDNVLIDVSITSTPVTFDENTKMAYLLFQDIRQRKEAELKLREAKTKAEESDKLKSAFLANLSHEIRTPMNAIVGFSSLITSRDVMSEEQKSNYGKSITSNCDSLVQLIDNIIDISKIEAKQIELTKTNFELTSLLDDLYFLFETKLEEKRKDNIKLIKDYNPNDKLSIYTDESRLYQVLFNLLDNAVKYTSEGYVKFGFIQENKDFLHFYIEDSGIGIDKPDQEIIFNRFTKIENNPNKLFRGTGIGLYISKRLIEEMGGHIYVESKINIGSKFFFTLPLHNVENEKVTNTEPSSPYNLKQKIDLANKKILIVEDTESSYIYLDAILSQANAKISWVQYGKEAISTVCDKKEKFDLILLDIQLPDTTGYEVARAIRKMDQSIPIIAQTAYVFQEDKSKSMQAGCNKYLSKPIKPEELFRAIEQLLF